MPGGKIDILVEPDLKGFPGKLQAGLQGATGVATGIGRGIATALGVGLLGAAAGFKEIIDLTASFQGSLNTLQAVTGATADQMAAASQRAQELGNDLTLPGTSAATAAEAMTELAKGGLTVEQAMAAAKGTLTLAAAAQIDGARAAQIQSDALNIFGLQAGEAGRVADILANSANASAVEITDVADAMKYVGPVAKAMGISIQDTATAIALLGNAGIRGEQAGTTLRGMLASLVAPSGAAGKAMKTLGLETRDAQGNFVGFESIIDQLRAAQGRLTEAQFQGAVTTAFGRETMSGVLALVNSAPGSWDKMAAAVTRQGGAQEVAMAKMKGLGGALEGFKSQLETTAITIGLALAPAVEGFVRGATDLLGSLTDMGDKVGGLTDKFPALNDVVDAGKGLWQDFLQILDNGRQGFEPIADGIGKIVDSAGREGGALSAVSTGLGLIGDAAVGLSNVLGPIGDVVGGILSVFAGLPGPLQLAAAAFLAFKTVPGILSSLRGGADDAAGSTGKLRSAVDGIAGPLNRASGGIRQFYGEMKTQQSIAAASGQAIDKLGAVSAAFETSTVGAVAAIRSFRDDVRTLQAAAAGAGAPISTLSAAFGALSQRSPAIAAMASSFRTVSGAVTDFGNRVAAGARTATESLGTNLASAVRTSVTAIQSLPSAASSAAAGLGSALRGAATSAGDSLRSLATGAQNAATATVNAVRGIPEQVGSAFRSVGDAARGLPDTLRGIGTSVGDAFRGIPGAVEGGISAIGRFSGAVAGVGSSIGTGLLRGAGSLVSFLGGPWGLALVAAGAALTVLGQHQQDAAKKAQEHQAALGTLAGTLDKYSGAVTQATINEKASQLSKDGTIEKVKQLGINTNDYVRATLGEADALQRVQGQLTTHTRGLIEGSNAYKQSGTELKALGLTLDDLTAAAQGNQPAIDKVNQSINAISDLDAQTSMRMLVDGMLDAGKASGDLAAQLGISNGELDKIQQQTKDASEASRDFGSQLTFLKQGFASLGTSAPQTEVMKNGLQGLATSAEQAATAAGQAAQAIGGVAAGGQAAASSMQQSRDAFIAAATGAGLTADQANILANQIGLIPAAAQTIFTSNATGATAEFITLGAQVAAVPGAKQITVQALSAEATTQLRDLGFEVKNLPNGQVQVDVKDEAGRAKLEAFLTTINTAAAAPKLDLNTATGEQKGAAFKTYLDGIVGMAKADADTAPGTAKADSMKTHIDGITALMKADADISPGTAKGAELQGHLSSLVSIMTADANNAPGTAKGDAMRAYIDGLLAVMTADANSAPGTAKGAALKAYVDGLRAALQVGANTASADSAIGALFSRWNGRSIMVGVSTAGRLEHGGIVAAMEPGGILPFAAGGSYGHMNGHRLQPMRTGWAAMVKPNTWRVVGDRAKDDEAYIPINRSRRSQAIFEETARRMGYTVARQFASGGFNDRSDFANSIRSIVRSRFAAGSFSNADVVAAIGNLQRAVGSLQTRMVTFHNEFNVPDFRDTAAEVVRRQRNQAAMGLFG